MELPAGRQQVGRATCPVFLQLGTCLRLIRLPHPPEELWLLGSALAMRQPDHHRSLRAWANRLGGVYAIRIATWHVRPYCLLFWHSLDVSRMLSVPVWTLSSLNSGLGRQCWQHEGRACIPGQLASVLPRLSG